MRATIYTKPNCPWCLKAKEMLADAGIGFREFDVTTDAPGLTRVTEVCAAKGVPRAVPQIWIDGTHIGGAQDLEKHLAA